MSNDYIPASDSGADAWGINFAALISANPTQYGLDASDASLIQTASDDFTAALALAVDPSTRTPVTVGAKDAQRKTSEGVWRPYAMRINADNSVSDADRVALGLTVRKTSPTPVPPPASAPALELRASFPGYCELGYSDTGSPDGKAKPAGSIGVQVYGAEMDGTTPTIDDADLILTATKSPFDLGWPVASSGKTQRLWARFVTRGGPAGIQQAGPWSSPLDVIAT